MANSLSTASPLAWPLSRLSQSNAARSIASYAGGGSISCVHCSLFFSKSCALDRGPAHFCGPWPLFLFPIKGSARPPSTLHCPGYWLCQRPGAWEGRVQLGTDPTGPGPLSWPSVPSLRTCARLSPATQTPWTQAAVAACLFLSWTGQSVAWGRSAGSQRGMCMRVCVCAHTCVLTHAHPDLHPAALLLGWETAGPQ